MSFSSDDGLPEPKEEDTVAWFRRFSEEELRPKTLGFDRGGVTPVVASDGRRIDFSPTQKSRIEKKERARRRWQRKLSRQKKVSNNRKETKTRLARSFEYAKEVWKDVFHKATHVLAAERDKSLFVIEDLKIKNMTKKPEPKQDDSGRYVRNGSRAKAGLNKSILSSGWGLFVILLSYKARKAGKLLLKVPPHHSSQECARCGHVHPDNRLSQAEFVCQRCEHTDNADQNASHVIARSGIRLLLEGKIRKKEVRRCGIGKRKPLGQERSEVKASGEENKTQRPKRLCASSSKEEIPIVRSETPSEAAKRLGAGGFI